MALLEELTRLFPVLRRLREHPDLGPVYVVGGAVRDLLRGAVPADLDVASNDPLACARLAGGRLVLLGREHLSAWRVAAAGHVCDFAALLDGSIEADLARRDFTINAMAVALEDGRLLDFHGGRRDLDARLVRMISPANFDDDPLRMLKAVRMAITLGFAIEPGTIAAIRPRAAHIAAVVPERVTYELSLILDRQPLDTAVRLLRETRLGEALGLSLPDVLPGRVPLAAALAILVGDARTCGRRWRWSERLTRRVITLRKLVADHDLVALYDAGEDVAGQLPPLLAVTGRPPVEAMPDFSIRPFLDGRELEAMSGMPPGRGIGELKRALLVAQVRGEVTTRAAAAAWVRAKIGR